jgi:hypothetical protein
MGDREEALARTNNIPKLHLIEVALPRLETVKREARKCEVARKDEAEKTRRLDARLPAAMRRMLDRAAAGPKCFGLPGIRIGPLKI